MPRTVTIEYTNMDDESVKAEIPIPKDVIPFEANDNNLIANLALMVVELNARLAKIESKFSN